MRDIEFRGKLEECKGEWIYGYYVYTHDRHRIIFEDKEGYYCEEEVVPETVGQFTGLKDKNGTKIYEGDIVKIDNGFHKIETGQVEWINCQANYLITWTEIGCKCSETFGNNEFTKDHFEVIGNIYKNSELLADAK